MAKPSPVIEPGASQEFVYTGEQIPFQVIIANTNTANTASYMLKSGKEGWSLYGAIAKGGNVSLMVQWPSGHAVVTNESAPGTNIEVGGLGIFPVDG